MKINKEKKAGLARYITAQFSQTPEQAKKHVEKIADYLENDTCRSPEQNKFYWAFLRFLSINTPEEITNHFRQILGDDFVFSAQAWHETLKTKFNVTSTAFDQMPQVNFNDYVQKCLQFTATYILKCEVGDITGEINNEMDNKSYAQ